MYLCICSATTEQEFEEIIKNNPDITIKEIQELDICNNCYKCSYSIQEILENRDVYFRKEMK